MKNTSLKKYISMRQSLTAEKNTLEARLHAINQALGGVLKSVGAKLTGKKRRKKFSAAARAAISAAQRARWAKIKAAKK
jgi:hypothetical protein